MRIRLPTADFDAWVLDCDGTLVDSMSVHFRAWQTAFRQLGAPFDFTWELFLQRAGMAVEQTVRELNQAFACELAPAEVCVRQQAAFLGAQATLQPIGAVVELCEQNRGKLPMVVASGGKHEVVVGELKQLGILDWFDFVVCAAEVPNGKPHPDLFLECARRLGARPSRCLVFEDAELGLQAAKRAGMGWVAVDGTERCGLPSAVSSIVGASKD